VIKKENHLREDWIETDQWKDDTKFEYGFGCKCGSGNIIYPKGYCGYNCMLIQCSEGAEVVKVHPYFPETIQECGSSSYSRCETFNNVFRRRYKLNCEATDDKVGVYFVPPFPAKALIPGYSQVLTITEKDCMSLEKQFVNRIHEEARFIDVGEYVFNDFELGDESTKVRTTAAISWPINLEEKIAHCKLDETKEKGGCSMYSLFCDNERWLKHYTLKKQEKFKLDENNKDLPYEVFNWAVRNLDYRTRMAGRNRCGLPNFRFNEDVDICDNSDLEMCHKSRNRSKALDNIINQEDIIHFIVEKKRMAQDQKNLKENEASLDDEQKQTLKELNNMHKFVKDKLKNKEEQPPKDEAEEKENSENKPDEENTEQKPDKESSEKQPGVVGAFEEKLTLSISEEQEKRPELVEGILKNLRDICDECKEASDYRGFSFTALVKLQMLKDMSDEIDEENGMENADIIETDMENPDNTETDTENPDNTETNKEYRLLQYQDKNTYQNESKNNYSTNKNQTTKQQIYRNSNSYKQKNNSKKQQMLEKLKGKNTKQKNPMESSNIDDQTSNTKLLFSL